MTPEARYANTHWHFTIQSWILQAFGSVLLLFAIYELGYGPDDQVFVTSLVLAGGGCTYAAGQLRTLARYIKLATANEEQLTSIVTEQGLRIQKLEQAVATLTAASSSKR